MENFLKKYKGIIAGIVFFSLGMVFYIVMQILDLWAPPENHIPPFCEYFDPDKIIGEPINTWSNWFLGRTGASSCNPNSWWQWHAYWHFGTAVAMLIIVFYILLEKEVETETKKV